MHATRSIYAALLAVAFIATAQVSRMTVADYEVREFNPDSTLAWKLHGDTAVIVGNTVDFAKIDGTLFSKDGESKVTTPAGRLRRQSKILSGDQKLTITRQDMTIEGRGYDLDLANNTLVLRSHVKIILQASPIQKLAKPPPTE